jgi:predicted amidophosphoribosyltransferase
MECLAFLVVAGVVAVAALAVFLGRVKCPYCRRRVERDAAACPGCGRDLEPEFWKRLI